MRSVAEIPHSWLGGAVPLAWTAWSEGKQWSSRVTGVDRDGSCEEAITLAASPKPEPPSEGLAFNRPTRVDGIVSVTENSPEWNRLRGEIAPLFRSALGEELSGGDDTGRGQKALALARSQNPADEIVFVETVFRDPDTQTFFIEVERRFPDIPTDTDYDAVSYGGWFRKGGNGALVPIQAGVVTISTAQGKLPRYTPLGIVRLRRGSIWVMNEWGIESQTVVLFEVSPRRVRRLVSTLIGGC